MNDDAFQSIVSDVEELLTDDGGDITVSAGNMREKIGSAIKQSMIKGAEAMKNSANRSAKKVAIFARKGASAAVSSVGKLSKGAVSSVGNLSKDALSSVGKMSKNAYSSLGKISGGVLESLDDMLETIGPSLNTAIIFILIIAAIWYIYMKYIRDFHIRKFLLLFGYNIIDESRDYEKLISQEAAWFVARLHMGSNLVSHVGKTEHEGPFKNIYKVMNGESTVDKIPSKHSLKTLLDNHNRKFGTDFELESYATDLITKQREQN